MAGALAAGGTTAAEDAAVGAVAAKFFAALAGLAASSLGLPMSRWMAALVTSKESKPSSSSASIT